MHQIYSLLYMHLKHLSFVLSSFHHYAFLLAPFRFINHINPLNHLHFFVALHHIIYITLLHLFILFHHLFVMHVIAVFIFCSILSSCISSCTFCTFFRLRFPPIPIPYFRKKMSAKYQQIFLL